MAGLSWLGRQGTRAVAALVVVGIALPPLGRVLQPFVPEAVFVMLCIAFLRVDVTALAAHVRRPAIVIAATAWTSIGIPALVGTICVATGLDEREPDLFLGIMLQAIASPMMAAPALAELMGLDATLALITLITGTAVVPLTAPIFAVIFVGPHLALSPVVLATRLLGVLVGAALIGLGLHRALGSAAIARHKERIDGLSILVLGVFVAAVMGEVGPRLLASPATTLALAALAFAVFFAIGCVTMLLFLFAGRERAFSLGLIASQRNMGLMLAVSGGVLPDLTWLYFALSQFPIYLSPHLLRRHAPAFRSPDHHARHRHHETGRP